jgi:hypothetical protein
MGKIDQLGPCRKGVHGGKAFYLARDGLGPYGWNVSVVEPQHVKLDLEEDFWEVKWVKWA